MNRHEPIIDVQLLDCPVQAAEWSSFPSECGAESIFLGRTRMERHDELGELTKLTYEAYRPLAERTMRELAQEAVKRFGCSAVRLHHAVGEVGVGEASVLVQIACGHRDQAFQACRFLIDELKIGVPIWKREVWERGSTWAEGTPVGSERAADIAGPSWRSRG